jgi:hypothetical protein
VPFPTVTAVIGPGAMTPESEIITAWSKNSTNAITNSQSFFAYNPAQLKKLIRKTRNYSSFYLSRIIQKI